VRFIILAYLTASVALAGSPLTVRDGQFLRDGVPYRGVGINYYDAFQKELEAPAKRRTAAAPDYVAGLEFLGKKDIPFVRFAACPFYPREWRIYRDDPERYFAILDGFVKEAERRNVGLIPCVFWSYFSIPDLVGEPVSAWGQAGSRTRAFMRRYTLDVVSRYKNSRAIWAWEFGNEFLTESDLPGPVDPQRWVAPGLGTANERGEKDRLTSTAVLDAYRDFLSVVRRGDAERPIMTGDAAPRVSAWHLARGEGWKPDSPAQWQEALAEANPTNTITVHLYDPKKDGKGYTGYGITGATTRETLVAAQQLGKRLGKPLWLGEFGPGVGETDPTERRAQVRDFLEWIETLRISLSAYWVFDSPNPDVKVWNAAPGGENAFVFEMIAEANRRLAAQGAKEEILAH